MNTSALLPAGQHAAADHSCCVLCWPSQPAIAKETLPTEYALHTCVQPAVGCIAAHRHVWRAAGVRHILAQKVGQHRREGCGRGVVRRHKAALLCRLQLVRACEAGVQGSSMVRLSVGALVLAASWCQAVL